ncbi:MAG: YdcF family protein [Propionibacteriaceae bacterium]|jgi:vancomycin permeability regulator SanA|nr:YdcF family protein [Propionibacteriaceae bacterium]
MARQSTRARPRRRLWRWLAAGLVLVLAFPPLATFILARGRTQTLEEVEEHDVAIVFGAGVYASGRPSQYLRARLDVARDLYLAGKVKVVIVSGSNPETHYNEPAAMRRYLVEQGLPDWAIVSDFAGSDTYATCVRARQVFAVRRAILVSQTYHLPRAIATCRATGLDAVGVGDETMRAGQLWLKYQLREVPGLYKMTWDVITGRRPVLGPPDDSVERALNH